ncbi:hypothetical protein M3Y94_00424100 [Aphelenchoides besseyi]|nr:hypothetical protein M3Y94_00424100 [Aphelenchoides besseyi]KAI6229538.1 hypothetical protein M3Y95_00541500 [Aphelenchoides besseyi]
MDRQQQLRLNAVIYGHFADGASESAARDRIHSKYGIKVRLSTIQKWYEKFRDGETIFNSDEIYERKSIELDQYANTQRAHLHTFKRSPYAQNYFIDGRYSIVADKFELIVVDLFNFKTSKFYIDNQSLPNMKFVFPSYDPYYGLNNMIFPMNLSTIVVIFVSGDKEYIGAAKLNFHTSRFSIKNAIEVPCLRCSNHLIGQQKTPNSQAQVCLITRVFDYRSQKYQLIDIGDDGLLKLGTAFDLPGNMETHCMYDNHLYGLVRRGYQEEFTELLKISITTNERSHFIIDNCFLIKHEYEIRYYTCICVGPNLYTTHFKGDCQYLFKINLNTMVQEKTDFVFTKYRLQFHSDGERTLLVTNSNKWNDSNNPETYRITINQPDSLFDCAWLAIQRRVQFHDMSLLSYAMNKLPRNSRLRFTLPQLARSTQRKIERFHRLTRVE